MNEVQGLLEMFDMEENADEIYIHPMSGDKQTLREWAEEFIANNPNNVSESMWNWYHITNLIKDEGDTHV